MPIEPAVIDWIIAAPLIPIHLADFRSIKLQPHFPLPSYMENVQTGQDGRNLLKISTLPSTKQNTNAQRGVSQHLVGSPNKFMRGCKFLDGAPVVTTLGWTLHHKLNDVSTSLTRSRHLICYTRYVVIRCKLLSSVKILYQENPFGELTKRSETAMRYNCSPDISSQ